ncbi:TonB-dependent receptor [Roseivirga seohaensis]|uniref:TonB-dependent receptor n=1 Tax=Roseivirga seohaensis TaxID=1914963 RepID=A0A150XNP1_9BACT|nr:TonB-dependent receptor [Roseivirga seohaensis]KYG80324.1 TonB-dependent receptor [Roseivirga seohaensis]
MKKLLHTLLLALLFSSVAIAQNGIISGKVTDEIGLGLPGATVFIPTINKGSVTDVNGNYTIIEIPAGDHNITVSYVGYKKVEQLITVVAGQTTLGNITMEPGYTQTGEVMVVGDRLKGQAKALNQQRTNANITNVVSADQVGRFPDANIGDALKRIPGITIQNDQGEARNIIIRGLAPQLNSVTLNGERIPSAEGDNRNVQLDLIPSDMIQTIQVNKAVLPNMDADAIGGSVNLVTRSEPTGQRLSGTLASGYNFLSDKAIWTGSLVAADRFANGKLGAVFSASYNNHNFGSDDIEAVWVKGDDGNTYIDEFDIREYRVQRIRRSANLALDYQINKNNKIFLSGTYNWRDDWENRFRMRVSQLEDAFNDGDFTSLGNNKYNVSAARVEFQTKGGIGNDRVDNRRLEDQRNRNLSLKGEHQLDRLKMTWSATYAKASEERPNERYLSYRSKNQNVNVDLSNPEFPLAILANPADNAGIGFNELSEQNGYTFDRDINGKLDFALPISENGILKFGGRARIKKKERDNNFFAYEPTDENAFGATIGDIPNNDYSESDFLPGSQFRAGIFGTPKFLGGLNLNSGQFDSEDILEEYLAGNYSATENIYAAYAMSDIQFTDEFSAILGLRLESTSIDYKGYVYDIDEEEGLGEVEDSQSYTNFMPGVHLNYNFSDFSILRFAFTNTIARPNYYDLVPYVQFSAEDEELEKGNPELKATTSMNFDLMYENYFDNIGIVSGGVFYKNLDNFIYPQRVEGYNDPVYGNDLQFTTAKNGGTAEIYGLEVSFQRQIWKGLGLYLNYTYTGSNTTGIQGREADDLELPGTANNMFNASLSYETEKLVLRASLNYASDYIDELGGESFDDRYYDKQTFVDVNGSYAFSNNWRFFFEVKNLTNQPLRYYQGISSRTMQAEYYNVRFNAGIKFDLFNN